MSGGRRGAGTTLRVLAIALCVAFTGLAGAERARALPPPAALHQLHWLIHEDLITPERTLQGFWEPLVDATNRDAETLVRGGQGPFDNPCCIGFEAASVATFAGADLLTIDSEAEFNQLAGIGGNVARIFVVQALSWCQGFTNAIGCADFPVCGLEPVGRKAVISLAAYEDFDSLGQVVAHELGHTTCLDHVANATCELMAASSGGGCLSTVSAPECSEYAEDAQASGGSCSCYADASSFSPDGQVCNEVPGGVCSGGVCGSPQGEAGATLFASADPLIPNGGTPNRAIQLSGATGEWAEFGTFTANRDVQGLAYSPGRALLYGVAPDAGDSELLLVIDPQTGATSTIGVITGLASNTTVVGLAWDPGATALPEDDRLLAVDLEGNGNFGSLYAIDPDDATATPLSLFGIGSGGPGGFRGLAYDPVNQLLYASAAFSSQPAHSTGLYRIDTVCASQCAATEVVATSARGQTNKFDGALAYDAVTHRIYHIGRQSGDRTEYDSYAADDLAANIITKTGTRGIDAFTIGGLAVLSIPEPGASLAAFAALASLFALRALRRPNERPAAQRIRLGISSRAPVGDGSA